MTFSPRHSACLALSVFSLSLGGCQGDISRRGVASAGPSWGRCFVPDPATSQAAREAYETFVERVVTSEGAAGFLRVWKPDSGTVIGSTVSEGMGYGLLLSVYHDDQETFDDLWRYVELYLNERGLMRWEIAPDGSVLGEGAATDGDVDIAFALVMAHRRFGSEGELDYRKLGRDMIEAIWDYEIESNSLRRYMVRAGDAWGSSDVTNLSYFAPAYMRVFGEETGNVEGWNAVIDANYEILFRTLTAELGNSENGLVPAWSDYSGKPKVAYKDAPTHFQQDSTRTPFRIGQDYCWYGDARAKAYLDKIASFYAEVGVDEIVDGYELDGTPRPERGGEVQAASFVGPAGVAFMSDVRWEAERDQAWTLVATGELLNGTFYYQTSWTALSLLMMSGDMVVY